MRRHLAAVRAKLWRNGQYFPLLYTRKAVEQETEKTINLVPKQ
jgi:penicillin amidase